LQDKYAFNLFGDPALDIFAEGYEVTRSVTADEYAEIRGTIRVHNGATLTITDTLRFIGNGKLIIEDNGNLVINNNAHIIFKNNSSQSYDSLPKIHVKGGGFTMLPLLQTTPPCRKTAKT